MATFHYRAYGLRIASEIELPELLPGADEAHEGADVHIHCGDVPTHLENPSVMGALFQAKPGAFLLQIAGVARYLAPGGGEIVVSPAPACQAGELRLFLLGPALGALLHQRGLLVLHASAVETPSGAAVFLGDSASGKSALAAALYQRGHRLLADESCAIALDEAGEFVALPAFPEIKLWADTLRKLGIAPERLRRVRPPLEKYAFPARERFSAGARRLHLLYDLRTHNQPGVQLEALGGLHTFGTLKDLTYFKRSLEAAQTQARYFKMISAVSERLRIRRVTRPTQPFLLEELADLIEEDWA